MICHKIGRWCLTIKWAEILTELQADLAELCLKVQITSDDVAKVKTVCGRNFVRYGTHYQYKFILDNLMHLEYIRVLQYGEIGVCL